MKKLKTGIIQKAIILTIIICAIILGIKKVYLNDNITLPDYDLQEIEKSEKEVNKLQNENTLSFSFITDVHINNEENSENNLKAFSKVLNGNLVKFGIVGGDLYSAYSTNHQEGVEYIKYVYNFLKQRTDKSIYFTKGNHDCNAKLESTEYISNEEYYNMVIENEQKNITINENDPYGGYYYKDFEENNIRLCMLNSFEGNGQQFIFNEKELEFIANSMLNFENKSNPEDWQVLFVSHTALVEDIEEFNSIIEAYENGKKIEINGKEIDYSKQGCGTVIAFIAGHQHIDDYNYNNGYLNVVVQRGYNTVDELNTENELCFSIFTIDTDNQILYETRFGRGEDRQWNYNKDELELLNEAA